MVWLLIIIIIIVSSKFQEDFMQISYIKVISARIKYQRYYQYAFIIVLYFVKIPNCNILVSVWT